MKEDRSPVDTAELRRLLAEATPGPWQAWEDGNQYVGGKPNQPQSSSRWSNDHLRGAAILKPLQRVWNPWWVGHKDGEHVRIHRDELNTVRLIDHDARLIAALRNAAPALLDEIDALRVLERQCNWFDPTTHDGVWAEKDLIVYPGNPGAAHWLFQEDGKGPKPDASCRLCGHQPADHHYAAWRELTAERDALRAKLAESEKALADVEALLVSYRGLHVGFQTILDAVRAKGGG